MTFDGQLSTGIKNVFEAINDKHLGSNNDILYHHLLGARNNIYICDAV